jgi:hypothetical protein
MIRREILRRDWHGIAFPVAAMLWLIFVPAPAVHPVQWHAPIQSFITTPAPAPVPVWFS